MLYIYIYIFFLLFQKYNEGMLEEYIKNQEKYTELKVDLDSSDE